MRTQLLITLIAATATLAACGERDTPIKTSAPGATATTAQANTPAAPADRESPPAATPPTHDAKPQPPADATAAATARDTPAQQPMKDLSAAEESKSMPKPMQTDNHSSPSGDKENKTTPAN